LNLTASCKIAGKPGGKEYDPFDYSFVNSEGVHA
jgi:hypothetical protein